MNEGRLKRKRKLIEIEYVAGEETLKVLKVVGKHLASMGYAKRGIHYLYPEEAVYLYENGSAVIIENGIELETPKVYSILEAHRIDFSSFAIYRTVKRMGLVVLRPRESTISGEEQRQIEYIQARNHVREKTRNVVIEQGEPADPIPDVITFPTFFYENDGSMMFHLNEEQLRAFTFIGADLPVSSFVPGILPPTRRNSKQCRPMYWPRNWGKWAGSWKEFGQLMHRMNIELQAKRSFYRMKRIENKDKMKTVRDVDYHVFSPCNFSHRLPARPLFSLKCCRINGPPLDVISMANLKNVVMAFEKDSKVNFLTINGDEVDLRMYLDSGNNNV